MAEFDDFLLKTERILEARRAAMNLVVEPAKNVQTKKERPEKLQQSSSREWSRLLLSVTDQTSGKSVNGDRFMDYGRTGVMLGKFILVLKPVPDSHPTGSKYLAEYRASSPDGGVIKLAEVSIEAEPSSHSSARTGIVWQTAGLDHNSQLATADLATILAKKLVSHYQANEMCKQDSHSEVLVPQKGHRHRA